MKKLRSKRATKILRFESYSHNFKLDMDRIQSLNDIIIKDSDEIKKVFFVKTYQSLFDDDFTFNSILREMHQLLPQELKEEIEIIICNESSNKMRKFLN